MKLFISLNDNPLMSWAAHKLVATPATLFDVNSWQSHVDVLAAFPVLSRGAARNFWTELGKAKAALPGAVFTFLEHIEMAALRTTGLGKSTWQVISRQLVLYFPSAVVKTTAPSTPLVVAHVPSEFDGTSNFSWLNAPIAEAMERPDGSPPFSELVIISQIRLPDLSDFALDEDLGSTPEIQALLAIVANQPEVREGWKLVFEILMSHEERKREEDIPLVRQLQIRSAPPPSGHGSIGAHAEAMAPANENGGSHQTMADWVLDLHERGVQISVPTPLDLLEGRGKSTRNRLFSAWWRRQRSYYDEAYSLAAFQEGQFQEALDIHEQSFRNLTQAHRIERELMQGYMERVRRQRPSAWFLVLRRPLDPNFEVTDNQNDYRISRFTHPELEDSLMWLPEDRISVFGRESSSDQSLAMAENILLSILTISMMQDQERLYQESPYSEAHRLIRAFTSNLSLGEIRYISEKIFGASQVNLITREGDIPLLGLLPIEWVNNA